MICYWLEPFKYHYTVKLLKNGVYLVKCHELNSLFVACRFEAVFKEILFCEAMVNSKVLED